MPRQRSCRTAGYALALGLSSPPFEARFQQIYGRSLDEAERDWRAFCAAYRP